jgi:glycosyltransferase involved in cell wall biosynthesis
MKVLMISGDKNMLTPGTEPYRRALLQRAQVDLLKIFFWGRGGSSAKEILRFARAEQFDVVTAQDPFWRGVIAWRVARKIGAKLQLQLHTDLSAQGWLKRTLAVFTLRKADSVRVVSEKIKKSLEALHLHAAIFVLPIYVDVSAFRRVVRKQNTEGKKTILWIGRFEEEKDPAYALLILKHIRDAGIDAKLVMLGAGSLEGNLRRLAQGMPVEFPGWQNPVSYLAVADVALCTSWHESWGASIVEALAAGVPVVAPDVGVAREAGAYIANRTELAATVLEVLQKHMPGKLKINLLSAEEWAKRWKETL